MKGVERRRREGLGGRGKIWRWKLKDGRTDGRMDAIGQRAEEAMKGREEQDVGREGLGATVGRSSASHIIPCSLK